MSRTSSFASAPGQFQPGSPDVTMGPRTRRLLAEMRWFVGFSIVLVLFAILFTFDLDDPGWSHSITHDTVENIGGNLGAWLADLMFFVFGSAAYGWCVLLGMRVARDAWQLWVSRNEPEEEEHIYKDDAPAPLTLAGWLHGIGFVLLMLGTMGYEALRFGNTQLIALPGSSGGVIGQMLISRVEGQTGYLIGMFILILSLLLGTSLYLEFSWRDVAEKCGRVIMRVWKIIRRERNRFVDERIGEHAAEIRGKEVSKTREQTSPHQVKIIREPTFGEPSFDSPTTENETLNTSDLNDLPENLNELNSTSVHSNKTDADVTTHQQALPALKLLNPAVPQRDSVSADTLEYTSRLIEKRLVDFGVNVHVLAAYPGPIVTRYEMQLAAGVNGQLISHLAKDLARSLSVSSLRVVDSIPGKNLIGIELPNPKRQDICLSELIGSTAFKESPAVLSIALGKDVYGKPVILDLAQMPHVLMAGIGGSGKTMVLHTMLLSWLYHSTPDQLRLILIDPKREVLNAYAGISHLLCPIVHDMRQAANALGWAVAEMEKRFRLMSHLGVSNIEAYNQAILDAHANGKVLNDPLAKQVEGEEPAILNVLPAVVIIVDELADLMMMIGRRAEELIARIAQKARTTGIHLILATQRPSIEVVTSLVKVNIPGRISLQLGSAADSQCLLDVAGAECLLGKGDLLYLMPGIQETQRVHGPLVSKEEVLRVTNDLKSRSGSKYIEGILDGRIAAEFANSGQPPQGVDPLYEKAVQCITEQQRASVSLLQRNLRISYTRAVRLLKTMEKAKLVSKMSNDGQCEVLPPPVEPPAEEGQTELESSQHGVLKTQEGAKQVDKPDSVRPTMPS
jgi:DNA segregation ATPase FtsK/SpoIIIE, S-DNA-T family